MSKKTANNCHILTLIPRIPILQTVAHLITPMNANSANSPTQCPLCLCNSRKPELICHPNISKNLVLSVCKMGDYIKTYNLLIFIKCYCLKTQALKRTY